MKYLKKFEKYDMETLSSDIINDKRISFVKTTRNDIGTGMAYTILKRAKAVDPQTLTILYDNGFKSFIKDLKLLPEKTSGYIIIDEFDGNEEDIAKISSSIHPDVQIIIIERYASDINIKETSIVSVIKD